MTYPEALRWLANKYHIEIHERELTNKEKEEQSQRESMFIVNEWAAKYFEDLLHNHADGVAVGMQYFRSRGFRDDIIRKFQLGFDISDRHALPRVALQKGYKEEYLLKTGICYRTDRGELIDRYAGRVVFPWIGVSGKVVGFTARVLDSRTKGVNQKYVNSPDSDIFHKDHELYGIWQAKRAIAKEDRVFMHTLHRFTSNITLIYDGDAAGIHAALRGTDMLLSEGMNLKVLLLPDGQDPDEFSRSHSAADFRKYIEDHSADFIQFKTDLMLRGEKDPKKRADAISSIVQSVSMVPNQILRDTYIHDCSQRIGIGEATLINQMNNFIRSRKNGTPGSAVTGDSTVSAQTSGVQHAMPVTPQIQATQVESMIIQLIIKHGEHIILNNVEDDEGKLHSLTVAQYIHYSLTTDSLSFQNEVYNRILQEAAQKSAEPGFKAESYFLHHDNIAIAQLAADMTADKYHLIEKEEAPKNKEELEQRMENETDDLRNQAMHLMLDFRKDYVEAQLKQVQAEIAQSTKDIGKLKELMTRYQQLQTMRNALAKQLGSNIIL